MINDIDHILFDEATIAAKVHELGTLITNDYAGKSPFLIGVLKGCFVFMADLAREINLMGMEMTKLIVSRIEKNQRHVCDGELKMLAKALGVTMEWLCSDDEE